MGKENYMSTSSNLLISTPNVRQRLVALDGIRGLAIALVILNHIPLGVLYSKLPSFFAPFLTILTANGKTGVSLLFLLSGFLMTWLYAQPKSTLDFWGKRYARVFPPFLVMVVALAIISSFKFILPEASIIYLRTNPWYLAQLALPIVLGVALLARAIWEVGVRVNRRYKFGKQMTIGFLLFQVGVAAWYVFGLLRVPPAVFYMSWSQHAQMAATTLVNATLTLPFGQYIAQLDGVYWSLITEVSFYLLYPVVIVPIIGAILHRKSKVLNIAVLLTILPFLFGLKLVSERVLGFSIMQIHLAVYFVVGIVLALLLRTKEDWKEKLMEKAPIFSHPVSILVCLVLLFSSVLIYGHLENFFHPWVQLFISVPIGFALFVALTNQSSFSKWLEQPWLVTLGKYSYSLYLIHSLVVEILTHGRPEPQTLWEAAWLTAATFALSLILAKILFMLIEAPYFQLRKVKVIPHQAIGHSKPFPLKPIFAEYRPAATRWAIVGLTGVLLVMVYSGYKSLSAFFTLSVPHSELPIRFADANPIKLPLSAQTTRFEFIANEDNLGLITTSLKGVEVKNADGSSNASSVPGELEIRLLNSNQNKLASTQYRVHEIGESRYHPFGFPIIPDSKGKKYYLEYQIVVEDPARGLAIEAGDAQFRTQYVVNKKDLMKNPAKFAGFVWNKLVEPFTKSSTLYVLIHIVPFLAVVWVGVFQLHLKRAEPNV